MPTPSLVNIPFITAPNVLFSQIPESGAGDFAVTRATTPDAGRSTRVNASGLIELVPDNVARLDYPLGGAVNGCPALLVEAAATNGIRNNSMAGAVAGSPGTLPTGGGWSTLLRELTQTIVGAGTENGIAYIDIRFSGTATSTNVVEIRYESNTQIVASSGQVWTNSIYLKKIAEPNPPNDYQLSIYERDSGGGFVAFGALTIVPTTTIQRFTQTRTLSGATTASVQPALFFNVTNGQYYDFTIRIGYPQMERGTVATSVIHTTTAAVTRSADVIRKTNIPFLIGQSEGTVYFEVEVTAEVRDRWIFSLDSAANSFIQGYITTARVLGVSISNAGGVVMTALNSSVLSVGYHKVAFAYNTATNGCEMFIDGVQNPVASRTVTGAGLPEFNNFTFGSYFSTQNDTLRGHVRAGSLYPNRLSDLRLEFLTAPVTYTTYAQMANALSYILP